MKDLKIPLDAEAFTSYIATHTALGHYQESERLYKQFQKTGQTSTIQILSTQIILHGKLQNTKKLEEIYHTATTKITTTYENSMLLNALICGYSYSYEHKKVMQIYTLLKKGKSKNQRKAEVFNRLESEIDNENFGINNVTLCVVIDSIGFNSNVKALEKCWKESLDSGIYMGVNVFTSLMEAYLRLGEVDKGVDVVFNYKKPNFKMLRNCLDLVPDSKRKGVYERFRKVFPDIDVEYKEVVVERRTRHIKVKSNVPEGEMELRNGVLILPGIKFQIEKLRIA
jgi:protein-arginine kinase activator protein McsA